jgi:sugar/nucleoside kinase (ribokinase family)
MTAPRYDCLCVGIVVADHVCDPIDHIPEAGRLVLTPGMRLTIGGSAANTAVDLATLGLSVGVAGTIGNDVLGRFVRDELEAAHVDCHALEVSDQHQTATTMVVNVSGEDRRFIHVVGAIEEFTGRQVTADLIRSSRVLHVAGFGLSHSLSGENVACMFQAAREVGVTTVLDVVVPETIDVGEMLKPVLSFTDVFLPNEDEARLITGLKDPNDQADEFRRRGVGTVVITCGDKGAILVSETDRLQIAPHAVNVVDGTGSGDAFAAGFIYGLLQNEPHEQCLRYGSALGAACVGVPGATSGALTAGELEQFIHEHPLSTTKM